jgi:2-methylisocitrate lyase-like PEP mutase family enzyme
MKKATTRLRELIAQGPTLFVPGCFNAMSAKVLETTGFPAIYMSGYGTSLSLTGLPDAGLATMSEMVLNARYIASAVRVPVIADADNGYGNAVNVIRTVREYIAAGVAGIHLEDQITPKRCGHVAGRLVVPLEEAVGKIRAAADARGISIRILSSSHAPTPAALRAARWTRPSGAPMRSSPPGLTSPSSKGRLRSRRCAASAAK